MISVPRNGASPAVGSVVWKTTNVMVSAVPSKTRASPPGGAQWTAPSTKRQSQPAFTSLAGLTLPAEADGAARARTASTTAKIQRRFISSPPPTPPAVTAESIKLAEITRLITRWAHAFRGRMVRGSEANRHSASGPLGAPAACRPPWASFQTTFSAMSNCFLTRGYSGVRPKPRAGPLSGPCRQGRMRGPGFERDTLNIRILYGTCTEWWWDPRSLPGLGRTAKGSHAFARTRSDPHRLSAHVRRGSSDRGLGDTHSAPGWSLRKP